MFTLIAATTNKNKLTEIRKEFDDDRIVLKSLADFSNYPEVIENGATFSENASQKARIYFDYFKKPVIADDSGLMVEALNNEPGVYSARYAGQNADYSANNKLLIEKIKNIPEEKRSAQFVCIICFKDENEEVFFEGIAEGIILTELRGKGGFGYDPLFYIPSLGKTYAQLSLEEKNALSHRGKALRKFEKYIREKLNIQFSQV